MACVLQLTSTYLPPLIRVVYEIGAVRNWTVEPNVANLLEAVEHEDGDLDQADNEHEYWWGAAGILVLVGILIRNKELNSFL